MQNYPPPPPPAAPAYPAQQYAPQPYGNRRFAGFWIRFAAYVIDSVLVGGIIFGLIKGLGLITIYVSCPPGVTDPHDPSCVQTGSQISPVVWVLVAAGVLYSIVLWAIGGTVGQRILRMRVISAQTGGHPGLGRALVRYVGYIVSAIPIYLGLIWIGVDARKQGWHDKVAGTFVVRT